MGGTEWMWDKVAEWYGYPYPVEGFSAFYEQAFSPEFFGGTKLVHIAEQYRGPGWLFGMALYRTGDPLLVLKVRVVGLLEQTDEAQRAFEDAALDAVMQAVGIRSLT